MIRLLEQRGLVREPHQTPLEFAAATKLPEAVLLTKKYNSVRFGEVKLSIAERDQIENWLGTFLAKG